MFYYLDYESNSHPAECDWDKITGGKREPCPIEPDHPKMGRRRINDLHIKLYSTKVPDILSTWDSEFIITDKVAELLRDNNLTGYELKPVVVTGILQGKKDFSRLPKLWELGVTGWGGLASKESGIEPFYKCPACGWTKYSALKDSSKLIDMKQWDGSDFFIVWPLPGFVFVTERVKEVAINSNLYGAIFIPSQKMRTSSGQYSPGKLQFYFDEERAEKLGGPLGIT